MNNLIKTKQGGGIRTEKRRVIKKLDDLGQRQVTFSKRRVGVFRKASELCALTGAECAIVCESYGGRVYAFGHPSVESVVDKYVGENSCSSELAAENKSESQVCMHEIEMLKEQYSEIMEELEAEKKKSVAVKREKDAIVNMERDGLFWWEQPFEHLEVEELEDFISSMEKLRTKLESRADDLKVLKTSSCSAMVNANNTVNSNDSGLSDEYSENTNLNITEGVGFMQDLLMNNNLNFNDDDELNELLAMKDPKFDDDDDGLDDLVNDFYLQNNDVQLPSTSSDTGAVQDADLQNFDYNALPIDFSFLFPPS
ncbi:MADS-box domain-containing protein [Heracleum sosnowskyi]|uniref:MADS-box domain-containing protein n=1 Tax=Heracleum sosnowskyi TaxID=360622 RepID=A0AAD8I5E3_9APIA|nr:MADS-box domain-containing protein [Heracleum sosnowskyi]